MQLRFHEKYVKVNKIKIDRISRKNAKPQKLSFKNYFFPKITLAMDSAAQKKIIKKDVQLISLFFWAPGPQTLLMSQY